MALLVVCLGVGGAFGEGTNGNGNGNGSHPVYPVIEVWKGQRRMELRHDRALIREFKIVLGQAPKDTKLIRGDMRTPVGRYYVSEKHVSRFHRFLGINYPNLDDAERGYGDRLIDAVQWADIFVANLRGEAPTWRTLLGGRVGIHGYGERPYLPVDWTQGCIAVSNDDIEFLYDFAPVGTPVIINE
jgi:murein L,D-transpeptidase YafK